MLPQARAAAAPAPLTPALDPTLQKAPPATGWVQGTIHGKPVDLTFDRRQSTLKGPGMDLKTDHEAGTITGQIGQKQANMRFEWSPQRINYVGDIAGRPTNLRLDFEKGRLEGMAGGNATDLRFDLPAGRIQGQAGHGPVDLRYDKVSGRLQGSLGKGDCDLTLTNLDLRDFLEYFYAWQ